MFDVVFTGWIHSEVLIIMLFPNCTANDSVKDVNHQLYDITDKHKQENTLVVP